MKQKIILLFFLSTLLMGCAGRDANPIGTRQTGDKELSCDDIESEVSELDQRARRLIGEQSWRFRLLLIRMPKLTMVIRLQMLPKNKGMMKSFVYCSRRFFAII